MRARRQAAEVLDQMGRLRLKTLRSSRDEWQSFAAVLAGGARRPPAGRAAASWATTVTSCRRLTYGELDTPPGRRRGTAGAPAAPGNARAAAVPAGTRICLRVLRPPLRRGHRGPGLSTDGPGRRRGCPRCPPTIATRSRSDRGAFLESGPQPLRPVLRRAGVRARWMATDTVEAAAAYGGTAPRVTARDGLPAVHLRARPGGRRDVVVSDDVVAAQLRVIPQCFGHYFDSGGRHLAPAVP